jgi:crotonobetainyl-CoA:carnitine CoA-transferase CaiB-like acyl-CoA transferase
MRRLPADANRPLAGIVVLDFGQVYQGPYATLLMAKAGADVAMQMRQGRMDLGAAQRGIAADWTQFLDEARRACPEGRC